MKDLKKKLLPFFSILAVVLIFFWKFVIKGLIPLPGDIVIGAYHPWLDYKWGYEVGVSVKNPILTDSVSFTYPMQTYAANLLKKGELPLWNPLILMGTPLLANFQSSPFSPSNFLYFLFDNLNAWGIQIVLQHVLAAAFTYALLRYWKVGKVSSVLGGLIYAFSGYNLIWSQWNGHTLSAAFIPLILLFVDRWLSEINWKAGVGVSLATALFFLSGYPQSAIYLALAILTLWSVRIYRKRGWLWPSILLGIFFVLGLGLSAFQILPGWELLNLSQRAVEPHPFEWAFLPWKKAITFFAADFYGNHATGNYWGPQDYTSNTGFVGVAAVILATLSLQLLRKNKNVLFAGILTALSLVLAFPTPISIYLWKSGIMGLNAASAHRSLVLFNLGIAILASFGLDRLKSSIKFSYKLLALALPFVILSYFGYYALSIHQTVGLRNLIIPFGVLGATSLIIPFASKFRYLIILLSLVELFYFGWKFTPFIARENIFPTTPVIDFLLEQEELFRVTGVIPINMKMPYGIETVEGYDAVYPVRTSEFMSALNSGRAGSLPLGRYASVDNDTSKLLDLINTKYYLVVKKDKDGKPSSSGEIPTRFKSNRFKLVFEDKSVALLESVTALPRSFYVAEWEVIGSSEEIMGRLLDSNFDFSKKVILEEDPPSDTTGFIFTSDTFYPGWKAEVDGYDAKIYRANYMFRAVAVTSPNSQVEYTYLPDSFTKGLKLAVLSLVLLVIIARISKLIK